MYKLVLPQETRSSRGTSKEYTVDDEQDNFDPIGMSGVGSLKPIFTSLQVKFPQTEIS